MHACQLLRSPSKSADRLQCTPKFLRLASPVVGDQQSTVELHESRLQLVLCVFIDIFLVVSDYALRNCLSDGVYLRDMATARDANPDIDIREFIQTDNEEWLVNLCAISILIHILII